MYDWLTARGVPARLGMETKGHHDGENLRCSLDLIEAETGTRPRADCRCLGNTCCAPSFWPAGPGLKHWASRRTRTTARFYCLMLAREVCSVWAALYSREALNQSFLDRRNL